MGDNVPEIELGIGEYCLKNIPQLSDIGVWVNKSHARMLSVEGFRVTTNANLQLCLAKQRPSSQATFCCSSSAFMGTAGVADTPLPTRI